MLLAGPHFVPVAEVGLRELVDDEQPVGIADCGACVTNEPKVLMEPAPEVTERTCRPAL
jgi:hypothetical protein